MTEILKETLKKTVYIKNLYIIRLRVIPLVNKQSLMERAGAHPSAGALVSSLPSYSCQEEKKKDFPNLVTESAQTR